MPDDTRARIIAQAKARQGIPYRINPPLRQVCPVDTSDDVPDHRLTDAELQSDLPLSSFSTAVPDLTNKVISQPRISVPRTRRSWVSHAPLLNGIRHVVGMRANEQVARPHAGRIVTAVADFHPFRDRAVVKFPRESVRANVAGSVTSPCQKPVAALGRRSCPHPTRPKIRANDGSILLDALPEAINHRRRVVGVPARTRAEAFLLGPISKPELLPTSGAFSEERRTLQKHQGYSPGVTPPAGRNGAGAFC